MRRTALISSLSLSFMLNALRRIVASPSSSSLFYSKRLPIARMSTTADAPAAPSGPVVGKLYMYKGERGDR